MSQEGGGDEEDYDEEAEEQEEQQMLQRAAALRTDFLERTGFLFARRPCVINLFRRGQMGGGEATVGHMQGLAPSCFFLFV